MTLALMIARDEMIMLSSLGIIAVVALAVTAKARIQQARRAGRIEKSLRNAKVSEGRVRLLKSIFSVCRARAAKARADDPAILRLIDFQIGRSRQTSPRCSDARPGIPAIHLFGQRHLRQCQPVELAVTFPERHRIERG